MVEGTLQSKTQDVKERLDEKGVVGIELDERDMMEVREHHWEKNRQVPIAPPRED